MSTTPPSADPQVDPLYRGLAALFAVSCLAFLVEQTARGLVAQDALPFLVAGGLALDGELDAVYPSMGPGASGGGVVELAPAFFERFCALVPEGLDCEEVVVPFLSPPPMLGPMAALAALPAAVGVAAFRLSAALCLAGGALASWRAATRAAPEVARPLALGLLCLIPFARYTIGIGQNASWLFGAAAVGALTLKREERWTDGLLLGVLLAGCALAKGSPALLVLVLVWARRWRAVATFVGVTLPAAAVAAALDPSLASDFTSFVGPFSEFIVRHRQNGSLDAAARLALGPEATTARAALGAAARIAALGAVVHAMATGRSASRAWCVAWAAWLVVNPLVWVHYLWVVLAVAVGTTPAGRGVARAWAIAFGCGVFSLVFPMFLDSDPAAVSLSATLVVAGLVASAAGPREGARV